jgi:energy-coupling factor transporter ATP-binding protein EcfA2
MKTKELFLIRGVSGAGKSTLAKSLGGKHIEADMFFMKDGQYKFDATKIKDAHSWCQNMVGSWMCDGEERIVVSNTFTQEWELQFYYDWALDFDYRVFSLIVENRHGGVNEHNVPEATLAKMKARFEVKL